jgi:hypothetical protein
MSDSTGLIVISFLGVAGTGVFLAGAQARIADSVGDEAVRLLGHFAAALAALGALNWLLNGTAAFFNYRSILREAEAD